MPQYLEVGLRDLATAGIYEYLKFSTRLHFNGCYSWEMALKFGLHSYSVKLRTGKEYIRKQGRLTVLKPRM
jgi:hypothetical protein